MAVGLLLWSSAARAAEPIDLSHVPARAVAAVVLHPERLAQSPELELLPWEVIQVTAQREMGFDPLLIQTAIGFAAAPTGDEPPDWGVVLRFNQPQPLAAKWLEQTETDTVGQVEYQRALQPMEPSFCQIDDRTLLIGADSMVREMIVARDADSPLRQILSSIPMRNDITAVIAVSPIRDLIKQFTAAYNRDAEGKPLLSWRVHLLPFLEERALYEQFRLDEPWDSPHNGQLIAKIPEVFRSPSSQAPLGKTNYLGVRDETMAFIAPKLPGQPARGSTIASFTDGMSNTVMIVEANDQSAVEWTRPVDFEPDPNQPTKGLFGLRPDGLQVAFVDGSVRFISEQIDPDILLRLFTKSDGQPIRLD